MAMYLWLNNNSCSSIRIKSPLLLQRPNKLLAICHHIQVNRMCKCLMKGGMKIVEEHQEDKMENQVIMAYKFRIKAKISLLLSNKR